MVIVVRCHNAACRKYMMVEEAERGSPATCLICKKQLLVPGADNAPPPPAKVPVAKLLPAKDAIAAGDLRLG